MNKRKKFIGLERSLELKFKKENENQVSLDKEDFKDGKLTFFGFHRLKQQCEHISIRDEIEISAPEEYAAGLRDTLERTGAGELLKIKKDKRGAGYKALILFAGGMLFLLLGFFSETLEWAYIVRQIVIIASWVFIWAAVEKFFFERTALRGEQLKLLHIISAKITPQPLQAEAAGVATTSIKDPRA